MNRYTQKISQLLLYAMLFCAFPGISQDENQFRDQIRMVLNNLKSYEYLDSRNWSKDFDEILKRAYQSENDRKMLEEEMLAFLNTEASPDAQKEILYQLGPFASSQSVDHLLGWLDDPHLFDATINTLSFISDPNIDKHLLKVLKKTPEEKAGALILLLGDRSNPVIVPALSKRLKKSQEPILLTLNALGNIETTQSAEVLLQSMNRFSGEKQYTAADNLVRVANGLERSLAFEYYLAVIQMAPSATVTVAALKGMIKAGQDPVPQLTEIFNSSNELLIKASMHVVIELNEDPPLEFIQNGLEKLQHPHKAQFLMSMAARGDTRVRPYALDALKGEDEEYQLAGLKSLMHIGRSEDVDVVAMTAANSRGTIRDQARRCLYSWKGADVDEKILELIPNSQSDTKEELILAIGPRKLSKAEKILLESIHDDSRGVRVAALRMVGETGNPSSIPQLLGFLGELDSRQEQNELVKTISRLASSTAGASYTNKIFDLLLKVKEKDQKILLIEILGNIGSEDAYAVIKDFLKDENEDLQLAAIRALSAWPNDKPIDDLWEILNKTADPKRHTLSLMGIERLTNASTEYTKNEKAKALVELLNASLTIDESKIVLSGLGKTGSLITFEVAIELLSSRTLQSEAEAAIIENFRNVDRAGNAGAIEEYLKKAFEQSTNKEFKDRLSRWLQ